MAALDDAAAECRAAARAVEASPTDDKALDRYLDRVARLVAIFDALAAEPGGPVQ
jgi:hypothetical protein